MVHVGTYDLNSDPPIDPDHAPDRLAALIDQLLQDSPDAVILVAQIISAANPQTQLRIKEYNDAIPSVVTQRASDRHIAVVDFRDVLQASDYSDELHPNDRGYQKMADVWLKAIEEADSKGWIKAPSPLDSRLTSRANACDGILSEALQLTSSNTLTGPLAWFASAAGSGPGSGSAGGTGTGSGNGNGESGGSGGDGGSFFGGGLPFSRGGLRALGLPTRGDAAINALKPYAITAQNAISSALDFLSGLGAGSSGADVSAAVDLVATVESDFTALSDAASSWELDSFGPANGQIFTEVQNEQNLLKDGAKALGSRLSRLRNCVSTPGACESVYKGISGVLIGGTLTYPLAWIITHRDGNYPSPKNSTGPSMPREWILNTVPGTSVKDFRDFIQTLPDRGSGRQMVYSHLDYQNYVTRMTREEAMIVSQTRIVDMLSLNDRVKVGLSFLNDEMAKNLSKALTERADDRIVVKETRYQQKYQAVLSHPRNLRISDIPPDRETGYYNYAHDETEGRGSFVYVFDGGFKWDHQEFTGRFPESYLVPGMEHIDGDLVENMEDDSNGHGTAMAALVVGRALGTAKLAKVIGVKVFSTGDASPEDMVAGWRWAINDVREKGRDGKAVFVHSVVWPMPQFELLENLLHEQSYYEPPYNIPPLSTMEWWVPLLAEAWRAGIVTVVSSGNVVTTGEYFAQGDVSPQRFARPNNPLINVAAIESNGNYWPFNLPTGSHRSFVLDGPLTGENTIYALAVDIQVANGDMFKPGDYRVDSGTSYAAPQVGGLAAYFMTLPTTRAPPLQQLPMTVKNHLTRLARSPGTEAAGTAYNSIWEQPCGPISKREESENEMKVMDEALRKLKELDLNLLTGL
ncbi:MAG: hypothetical protein Q9200_002281 [Gallowayella weberi]